MNNKIAGKTGHHPNFRYLMDIILYYGRNGMFWFQEGLERLLHLLGNMEMPLGAYYTNTLPTAGLTPARGRHECIINFMRKSRTQETPVFLRRTQTPAWVAGRIWDFQTKTGIK